MGAVDFFTNIVGQVEDCGRTSWSEHTVVDGLNHPTNFLGERQVGRWREGQVGGVERRGGGAGIVGVQTRHIVAGIRLDEDTPVRGRGCSAVGPREGRRAVGLERMGGRIPYDGGVAGPGVHTAHGWGCDGSIFPNQRQVGALIGASFGGCKGDFVGGFA